MRSITWREIAATNPEMRATLQRDDLPTEDLERSEGRFFRFERDAELVGFGGFEVFGVDALLRSVVVPEKSRGTGAGRAIAEALANEMRDTGARHAYLLTTTAESFFRHLGYTDVLREKAPAAILATPQATTICRSAAMLTRVLG